MKNVLANRLVLMSALLGAAACGNVSEDVLDAGSADAAPDARVVDAQVPDAEPADARPPGTILRKMVSSALRLPTSQAQSTQLAFDIDGDPGAHRENALGAILVALKNQAGLDAQPGTDASLAAGELIMLHVVRGSSVLDAPQASWSVYTGLDHPSPDFTGGGTFQIDPGAPTDSLLEGSIVAGHFLGGPGKARIELAVLTAAPVALDLMGVRLEAQLTDSGCTEGRIGGGILATDVDTKIIPALAESLEDMVEADAGCPSACSSQTTTMLNLFDSNDDGTITVEEVAGNALIHALFAPDLDLLDASGFFNPLSDGVKDSLSMAIGLSCAGATFELPGE